MAGKRCQTCGKDCEELEPAFRRPDAFFAVPEGERAARVRESDDLVAIDDAAFFIRCVAPIPVKGRDGWPYSWGFWVKAARDDFEAYRQEYFDRDPPPDHPGFQGTIANQTPLLPPTLGLPVHIHLGRGKARPKLMLLDAAHALTAQQEEGITPEEVHAWSERCTVRFSDDGWLDPPAPPFTASLDREGWRVAEPEEYGKTVERLPAPPRPGELVKAPFVFLAADARGDVTERAELMWVLLDEVRPDGRWSGTLNNHPFVPGPLDCGTRVWLDASRVLAWQPAVPAAKAAPGLLGRVKGWLGAARRRR